MYQVPSPLQSLLNGSPAVVSSSRQRFVPVSPTTIQPSVSGVPTIPSLYQNNMSRVPSISRVPLSAPVSPQRILSSRTTNQPIQILTPRTITTNNPVTIKTTQNVLSSQISTVERPFNIITSQHVQTPAGTYQVGQTVQPTVRYQQIRTVTPEIISYSQPVTITSSKRIMVRQPANVITTQNVVQAARPPRIISTSQPVITPVGPISSAIQGANNFTSIINRARTKGINNLGVTSGRVDPQTGQTLLFQQPTSGSQFLPLSGQPLSAQLPAVRISRTQPLPLTQTFRAQTLGPQPLPLTQPLQVRTLRTQPFQVQSLGTRPLQVQSLPVQSVRVQSLPTPVLPSQTLPVPIFRTQSLPLAQPLTQPLITQTGQPISIRTVTTRTYRTN